MASTLEKLNPGEAWQPASKNTWNLKWAAHLYRRAAFAVPPSDVEAEPQSAWDALQASVKRGLSDSLEELLEGKSGQDEFNGLMDNVGETVAKNSRELFERPSAEKLQGWWLYRMLYTPHPLLERCTLMWHNHFATSLAKVGRPLLMFRQNQLLRKHALGKFSPLLHEISRDAAMLVWLDGNSSIKGRPNENYARELMELFSLGVGHYTEADIREAARALTGWSVSGGKAVYNKAAHDDGSKTVLGHSGRLTGDDVVDIVLEQPAAARFLVRKLFREFISEFESPPDRLIEPLAVQLRESDYDVKGCLATMLRSKLFFSEHAYRNRIKSPVEYVVGLIRSLDGRDARVQSLAELMDGLGQALFAPPSVKGWDGGKAWLNTATLLARHNLASKLLDEDQANVKIDLAQLVESRGLDGYAGQVDFLLELLLQGDVSPQVRNELISYAIDGKRADAEKTGMLRTLTHAILTTPEYQCG
jgi:hypothetical protein